MTERHTRHVTLLALASLAGCAGLDDASDHVPSVARYEDPGLIDASLAEPAEPPDASVDAGPAADAGVTTVRDPNGAYFADVTANGTGCPAGTWTAAINPDGQAFTLSLSAFEAEVNRTRSVSIKDCTLSFKLHAPRGLAYTVEEFGFAGYAYLESGISLRVQTDYYFQGSPEEGAEVMSEMVGPMDRHFDISDVREDVSFVRSRCGEEQTLNVRMTIRLRNSNPRGNGYANIPLTPLRQPTLKLSWKRCNE